jgi:hypothetical protein
MLQNPEDISKKAKEIELGLLPAKSRVRCYKEYDKFNRCKENNGVVLVNEDALPFSMKK